MSELGLADGAVLYVGRHDCQVVDVARDRRRDVSREAARALELSGAGKPAGGAVAQELAALAADGWMGARRTGADPVLCRWLDRLDGFYLEQYRAGLGDRALAAYAAARDGHARRKRFLAEVAQCPVLPETALRRALLVGDAEEVGRRRVLCVGDDDLVSLPLAALGHEVTVVDLDAYLLDLIAAASPDVRLVPYDFCLPVPRGLGPFDCFLTDPVSNRACFELFLSRGLSLLAPRGEGFVAVHPPASRLLAQVARELGCDVADWWRNHNRYYSTSFVPDPYVSDWVRLRPTPAARPRFAATAPAGVTGLYREDTLDRAQTLHVHVEDIETRYAVPLYLELLLDAAEQAVGLGLRARYVELGDEWTVVHGPTAEGYFALHVDRARRRLTLSLRPYEPGIEECLRGLVFAGYKTQVTWAAVMVGWRTWDVRWR